MSLRIGIDLGGTKIEAIALGDTGAERFRRRVDTPRDDYAATVAAIVDLVGVVERELRQRGSVGVGMPGTISPATGLVKNANSTWLIGHRLHLDLERALDRPIGVANDANCFALSEAADGAAAGARVVFGVILGTGTGGGVVVNGEVLVGPNAVAGEWGHNALPWPDESEWPGPSCYCGKRGCIETFLSGSGLQRAYTGSPGPTALEIAAAAKRGDPVAAAAIETYARRLAKSLATVINILDPDVIVLGGGVSNEARLYTDVAPLCKEFVLSDDIRTRIVRPMYGDSSGVRGAAWLWK